LIRKLLMFAVPLSVHEVVHVPSEMLSPVVTTVSRPSFKVTVPANMAAGNANKPNLQAILFTISPYLHFRAFCYL
jgi:hypothetical protein